MVGSRPHVTGSFDVVYVSSDQRRRERVRDALSELDGVSIEAVPTAAGCRSLFDDGAVDCVISDQRLEETDGLALLEWVRGRSPNCPFVLYADGDESLASDAVASGVDGYVPRSADDALERLLDTVARALEADAARAVDGHRLDGLLEVESALESCTDPAEAVAIAVETMDSVFEAAGCAMFADMNTQASTRSEADLAVVKAVGTGEGLAFIRDSAGGAIAKRSFTADEAQRTDPIRESYNVEPPASAISSVVSVPVGEIGVLQVVSTHENAFDGDAVRILRVLASLVATTISRTGTEHVRLRERSLFSALFQPLFEAVSDGVALTEPGPDGEVLAVNGAFEDQFGYARDALIGEVLQTSIESDGDDPALEPGDIEPGTVTTREVEQSSPDGKEFLVREVTTRMGRDTFEYQLYRDVTEQRQLERDVERFRTLVAHADDPMFVLDDEGRVDVANDALAERLGASREDLLGEHYAEFFSPESVEAGERLVRDLLEDDSRRSDTLELTIDPAAPEREPFPAEATLAVAVDEDGSFEGTVGVLRDPASEPKSDADRRRDRTGGEDGPTLEAEGGPTPEAEVVAATALEVARTLFGWSITAVYLWDDEIEGLAPVAVSERTEAALGDVPVVEAGESLAWEAYDEGELKTYGGSDDRVRGERLESGESEIRRTAHVPMGDHGILLVGSTEPGDFDDRTLIPAKLLAEGIESALDRVDGNPERKLESAPAPDGGDDGEDSNGDDGNGDDGTQAPLEGPRGR
ncbi:PAS domain S-box protein [Natrialbaceae archaeon GCM10025810]|uniref:PAS domain S-box protein n=1 Tax=Halovalidus salilacus TaxID=3075124 RepID=UPI003610A3F2